MAKKNTEDSYMLKDNMSGYNQFASGFTKDMYDLYSKDLASKYDMARNAVGLTVVGDMITISNEMSNKLVAEAPYTIIGRVYIKDGQWGIFSTDDDNCEIGIFDEHTQLYTRYVNSKELNFRKTNLIKGVGRIKRYCHRMMYWDDDRNPSRFIDLDDIKWKGKWAKDKLNDNCLTFIPENDTSFEYQDSNNPNLINEYYKRLDVSKILLSPSTEKGLSFSLNRGNDDGELINGTYVVVGYYCSKDSNSPLTGYFNISNPQTIFNHNGTGGSLEVDVIDIDEEFEYFALAVVYFEQQNYTTRIIGTYSTNTTHISITQIDSKLPKIDISSIITDNSFPERTAEISKVGNYLVRIKPTMHQDFNYQPYANNIKVHWVSLEYDMDYYKNGGNKIGYMRDEVYSFFIRWIYNTGDHSKSYHIPGREIGNNANAYELNSIEGVTKGDIIDGARVVGLGEMAFWESEERYDDKNPSVWGELCGYKIRHHKMPSNDLSSHYNKNKIHILGVKFSNIHKPTKLVKEHNEKGEEVWVEKEIDNIVGYEILRGSREGHKSIIAKGMINNMRSYQQYNLDGTKDSIVYYQNYPYNSNQKDQFVTSKMLMHSSMKKPDQALSKGASKYLKQFNGNIEEPYELDTHMHHDMFTFHSPELKAYSHQSAMFLSAKKLRTYGRLQGTMDDIIFQKPEGAPLQKLLNNTGLISTIIIGLGYAMFKMYGRKKHYTKSPVIDYGDAMAGYGVVETSSGMGGVSAPNAILQSAGSVAEEAIRRAWKSVSQNLKPVSAISGTDIDETESTAVAVSGTATATVSGKGPQMETELEETEWKSIPKWLRITSSIPIFMTYWLTSMNNIIEMMYSFAKFKNHTLQQMSHGFYETWDKLDNGYIDRNISSQTYLNSKSFTKLQTNEIINNVNRPYTIALKLDSPLAGNEDNSQILFSTYSLGDKYLKKNIESYYTSLIQPLPSQYGKLKDIVQIRATFNNIPIEREDGNKEFASDSPIVFGGDTFIARYTEKNTMFFFYDWLDGQPDGTQFDYSKYQYIAHPRFWMNTTPYDLENITEAVGSLFTKNNVSDFEPFNMSQRFTDSTISLENGDNNIQIDNFETQFKLETKDAYPEVVQNAYNEAYKNSSKTTSEEKKEEAIGKANEALNSFNSTRVCSCTYKHIMDRGFSEMSFSDKYKELLISIRDDEDLNADGIITPGMSFFSKEQLDKYKKNSDNFIYDRSNQFSLNNCDFFKYNKSDNDNENDKSIDYVERVYDKYKEEFDSSDSVPNFSKFKNKASTKRLWYNKSFKLGKSEYDKLCELKNGQEKAELNYAIGLGYIKFLQFYYPGSDETDNNDEDVEFADDFAALCWFRKKKFYDKAKDALDLFTDPWTDDHELFSSDPVKMTSNFEKGYWAGTYDGIPYTLNPNRLNPLLAYFISEETDVKLNYPTESDFEQDWNKGGITKSSGNGTKVSKNSEEEYYPFGWKDGKLNINWNRVFKSFEDWGVSINSDNINSDDHEYYGYNNSSTKSSLNRYSYMEAKKLVYGLKFTPKENNTSYGFESKILENIDFLKAKVQAQPLHDFINYSLTLDNGKIIYCVMMSAYAIDTSTSSEVDPINIDYWSNLQSKDKDGHTYSVNFNGTDMFASDMYQCYDNDDVLKIETSLPNHWYTVYILNIEDDEIKETTQHTKQDNSVDINEIMTVYNKLNEVVYDTVYTTSDDMYKYWTISGCRSILKINSYVNRYYNKLGGRYAMVNAGYNKYSGKTKAPRIEKCNKVEKYFEDKGPLYKKIKKLYKQQEKATKKYSKQLNKYTNNYNKQLKKQNSNNLLSKIKTTINKLTPGSYYALDYIPNGDSLLSWKDFITGGMSRFKMFVNNAYMYTFVSGVRDFYVETTHNIAHRDWGEELRDMHYEHERFTNIKQLFKTKNIKEDEKFIFYPSLVPDRMVLFNGFRSNIKMQNASYDPLESAMCLEHYNNRMLYSLPDEDTNITDGWRVFKMKDSHDFDDEITTVMQYMENGALILFKNSSPITFTNTVKLNGDLSELRTLTGTGELFTNQNMSRMSSFDSFEAASCQNSFSALSTPAGKYYVGIDQGRVYSYEKYAKDLTSIGSGLTKWFKQFMPYQLTRKKYNRVFIKNKFELTDNPVVGIGVQTSYDNENHIVYISKKDYAVKEEFIDKLVYDGNGIFHERGKSTLFINLGDKKYFDDASFTISLDLKKGESGWSSFHDWHPDLTMSSYDRIYSTKDNGIWRHNDSPSSYCNFYGVDYPFEVEFKMQTNNEVSTLRNISYFLETFVYSEENEYDRFHTLYDNFDKAIVYNSEQISGQLNLIHQDDNDPSSIIKYPKINESSIDILWSKEEQRYRFNQFWDITKDRMDKDFNTMFNTSVNGYERKINPKFVNYDKHDFERKKFRHRVNNVRLTKDVSGNVNFVFSFSINSNQKSHR